MSKSIITMLAASMLLVITSCQPAVEPVLETTTGQTAIIETNQEGIIETASEAEIMLTLIDMDGKTHELTMEEIKELPATEGQAGIKSSTGKITPPALFKGVLFTDLLKLINADEGEFGIEVEAEDGYAMTLSSEQVKSGSFITYDPATGDETLDAGILQTMVAYEIGGQPLDVKRDGHLRLVVISEKNNQVTDGHWSIKWVRKITVKPMAVEWDLELEGGIVDAVDRGSFESCSTSKCHQAVWTDEDGKTFSGTPLWFFAGRADDDIKHGDGSFNLDLYSKGYTVEVVAKDGYSAVFDIARLIANKDIFLANQVDSSPLSGEDFPLVLVGPQVSKKEAVGGVEKIILHFGETVSKENPESAKPASPSVPANLPEGKALMINGLVDTAQAWSLDELKGLEVLKLTVEHPKKGNQEVEGVLLSDLFELSGIKADAKEALFTASDDFSAAADLKTITSCKDCLVAFNESGTLYLAMPGLESSLWVKEIVSITIK